MSTVTLSDIHTEELIFPVEFDIEYLSEFKAVRKKGFQGISQGLRGHVLWATTEVQNILRLSFKYVDKPAIPRPQVPTTIQMDNLSSDYAPCS
jgi:hypothetical protein